MAQSRLCRACKDFHDLAQPWPDACASHFGSRGEEARFYVVRDDMAPIRSMASGKMHDSKSTYRRELKAMGCVELGNDRVTSGPPASMPPVREAMKQAIHQLRR